jgi:DivIVA domain-containing protein
VLVPQRESSPPEPKAAPSAGRLRQYVPPEILDVKFPIGVRGYDRQAVDAYVKRVNRVIAELKVSASPPAAVRHALDQAEDKVEGLLQAAREAAEQIETAARTEAEETTGRAKSEAAELVVNTSAEAERIRADADARVAEANKSADATVTKAQADAEEIVARATAEAEQILSRAESEAADRRQRLQEELTALRDQAETHRRTVETDTNKISHERSELLDDVRTMANSLLELANTAANRLSPMDAATTEKTEQPEGAEADTVVAVPAGEDVTKSPA